VFAGRPGPHKESRTERREWAGRGSQTCLGARTSRVCDLSATTHCRGTSAHCDAASCSRFHASNGCSGQVGERVSVWGANVVVRGGFYAGPDNHCHLRARLGCEGVRYKVQQPDGSAYGSAYPASSAPDMNRAQAEFATMASWGGFGGYPSTRVHHTVHHCVWRGGGATQGTAGHPHGPPQRPLKSAGVRCEIWLLPWERGSACGRQEKYTHRQPIPGGSVSPGRPYTPHQTPRQSAILGLSRAGNVGCRAQQVIFELAPDRCNGGLASRRRPLQPASGVSRVS
jgi:hypothetical protein